MTDIRCLDKEMVKQSLLEKNVVLHVAPPKSGSSWFDEIIRRLHKFKWTQLVSDYGRREQEIQYETFIHNIQDVSDAVYFRHQHIRLSKYLEEFINDYNVKIVLQTRNIFDTVYSLRDNILKSAFTMPIVYVDENFFELSEYKQLDMVIDLMIPWYFNFYVSWFEYMKENNIIIFTYEEMCIDTMGEVSGILNKLNVQYSKDELNNAIEMSNLNGHLTNLNKGIVGRGKELSKEQKNRILKFASYYPHIDFSIIGIDNCEQIT